MHVPLKGLINVEEISLDTEYLLVVKVFDENEFYEFHFNDVLRVFYYKEKDNLTFNQIEGSELLKKIEIKYFDGHPDHRYNHYQFVNERKEKCIEVISESYEIKSIGNK